MQAPGNPDETIFDKILAGQIPAAIVHEDDHVLAFKDIQPQAKVHVLVIPKLRATSLHDLKDRPVAQIGAFMAGVARVAEKLGLAQGGYRVVLNTGPDAGQTVFYVHAHILGGEPLGRFGA
ncbi:histidine triad nucleotide-binding protein [bacterium]|nr:histidine triad nucleotide-binding protein [bacterium]